MKLSKKKVVPILYSCFTTLKHDNQHALLIKYITDISMH
jgi:hypothetical protein